LEKVQLKDKGVVVAQVVAQDKLHQGDELCQEGDKGLLLFKIHHLHLVQLLHQVQEVLLKEE